MTLRGVLAEIQRQSRRAERERERLERETARAYFAAVRATEQARKAAERTQLQLDRASAAEAKRLEKEARQARVAAREAEVAEKNALLEEVYEDIDTLLQATLGKDDFVELQSLRVAAQHPPFPHPELEVPIPLPRQIPFPPDPVYTPPEPPRGLLSIFSKGRHAAAIAEAEASHARALQDVEKEKEQVVVRRREMLTAHVRAEAERQKALERAKAVYERECAAREADAAEHNLELDELILNLGYGSAEAIEEYVSLVLANSVYPDIFKVRHEFEFDPSSAELRLVAIVPSPDSVPTVKAYRYAKATDEITSTALPLKAIRDRYESAVHQVALRSLHEVFEADRRGLIRTISLTVATEGTIPATGLIGQIPFVVVAAERDSFLQFDLSAVVPEATLKHLGAAVSKNPFALAPVETRGIRRT